MLSYCKTSCRLLNDAEHLLKNNDSIHAVYVVHKNDLFLYKMSSVIKIKILFLSFSL